MGIVFIVPVLTLQYLENPLNPMIRMRCSGKSYALRIGRKTADTFIPNLAQQSIPAKKNPGGFEMKNVSRVALSVLAFLFFVSMVGILPSRANGRTGKQAGQEQAPQAQTVSGKIASVDKSSFTLTVATGTS